MANGRMTRGRIQRKVIASILLAATIPVVFIAVMTYIRGMSAIRNSIGAYFQELARETADKIDIIMDDKIQDARSLALSPYVKTAVLKANQGEGFLNSGLTDYLMDYQKQRMGEYGSILITDQKGVIIAATMRHDDDYHGGKEWWHRAFNDGKGRVYISGIGYDKDVRGYSMTIAVPILDRNNGKVIGILKAVHDVRDIFKVVTNLKRGKTGHANLVTSDGTLIICPLFPPESHRINDQLMRLISTGKPGWGVASDDGHGGKDSIVAFAPVISTITMEPDNFGGRSWYIFIRQLPEETYAPIYALLWKESILGTGIIAVLFLLGYYSARRIVKPIGLLTDGVELIGQGRLDHRINIRTNDEIEQLAETFNHMADNLEKGSREREGYLHQLEESKEEIRLERDKLETIIESMGDGLDIVDRNFRIQYMNERFLNIFGVETIGRYCYEIYTGRNNPCYACPVVKGIEKTGILEVNTPYGQTFLITHSPIRNRDGTISILEIFKDITERKKLEMVIEESEEQYRTLFDYAEDSMLMVDLEERVVAVNKREEKVIGYPKDSLMAQKFSRILPQEERKTFSRLFEMILRGEEPPTTEVKILSEERGLLTMEMALIGIKKGDGIAFVLIHLRDVTRRKELEQQLLRSERLNALVHFSSTLVHDLRNPIIGIKKRLEGLESTLGTSSPGEVRRVLADLISGNELLVGMVNDVLDVYQNSYEELPLIVSTFSLIEAIEEAIKLLHVEMEEKGIFVELVREHQSLTIQADKRRLQRVFINLLDNAIKYSTAGGTVEIIFRPEVSEGIEWLLFDIRDKGPGILPSELSRIFEPFHRKGGKKTDKTGTGLGLYFCRVVVEAHQGKIWAENRPEGGSVFCIKIPVGERENVY